MDYHLLCNQHSHVIMFHINRELQLCFIELMMDVEHPKHVFMKLKRTRVVVFLNCSFLSSLTGFSIGAVSPCIG